MKLLVERDAASAASTVPPGDDSGANLAVDKDEAETKVRHISLHRNFTRMYYDQSFALRLTAFAYQSRLDTEWGYQLKNDLKATMLRCKAAKSQCQADGLAAEVSDILFDDLSSLIDADWIEFGEECFAASSQGYCRCYAH